MHGTYIDCKTFYSYANKARQSSLTYAFNRQEVFFNEIFSFDNSLQSLSSCLSFLFSFFLKQFHVLCLRYMTLKRIHGGRQSAKNKWAQLMWILGRIQQPVFSFSKENTLSAELKLVLLKKEINKSVTALIKLRSCHRKLDAVDRSSIKVCLSESQCGEWLVCGFLWGWWWLSSDSETNRIHFHWLPLSCGTRFPRAKVSCDCHFTTTFYLPSTAVIKTS